MIHKLKYTYILYNNNDGHIQRGEKKTFKKDYN